MPPTDPNADDAMTAQQHSVRNRNEIEDSHLCGCFHCATTFRPAAIIGWRSDGPGPRPDTARCPNCGIDTVIGSASGLPITEAFLKKVRKHWFRR